MGTTESSLRVRARVWLARRFAIDTRALAALRIALGTLLLFDLALRARNLTWFYTDAGVLPRATLRASFPGYRYISLHALSGDLWVQVLLFVLAGGAALALLVGYRTRTATAVSLLFLLSLQARNPLVLNAGDVVLRRLLFWSVFLPLGSRWSIDRVRSSSSRDRVVSVASAALLLQVVILYSVNAGIKLRATPWLDGTAVPLVFSLEQFTVLFGDVLANVPIVLTLMTWTWLALVTCSGLLVVLTGWPRVLLVSLFASMHLGMLLTMQLGLFPLISIAALLPFLPSAVWDAVEQRTSSLAVRVPRRFVPAELGPLLPDRVRAGGRRLGRLVVVVLVAGMLLFNAVSVAQVGVFGVDSETIDEQQRWSMFAPSPPTTDGWFVIPGTLDDGSRVDAFYGRPVQWEKPPDVSRLYPTARWRKYLSRVESGEASREAFATSLCSRWQQSHDQSLDAVSIYYIEQPTRLDGPEPTHRRKLATHECEPDRNAG